jgi:hypothetical protein
MIAIFIVVGVLTIAFAGALVIAALADRRRSIEVDSDPTRFEPPAPGAALPWA